MLYGVHIIFSLKFWVSFQRLHDDNCLLDVKPPPCATCMIGGLICITLCLPICQDEKIPIRLWAQNLNVLLLCNPVTTQWCSLRGQMSHNVSKRTKLL